jgi:hypothetical protein
LYKVPPNKYAQALIDSYKVRCPSSTCDQKFKYKDMLNHIQFECMESIMRGLPDIPWSKVVDEHPQSNLSFGIEGLNLK